MTLIFRDLMIGNPKLAERDLVKRQEEETRLPVVFRVSVSGPTSILPEISLKQFLIHPLTGTV